MDVKNAGGIGGTDDEPKTLSVPEAGRKYFCVGTTAAYAAVRRGEIPTIRIGGKLRVPVIALERMLETAGQPERPEGTN